MKKSKLALGLLAVAASAIGLSGCNEVTEKTGVVLEFKTSDGTVIDYTVDDLFASYRQGAGYASTSFEAIYQVLIRHYYEKASESTRKKIDEKAQAKVISILNQADTNATNSKTSYEAELETLLKANNVENIAELKEAKVYEVEKELFETDYYSVENLEFMRDGVDAEGKPMFPTIENPEIADNEGYLLEKMPYHVSHILAKLSCDGSLTQGQISEADAKKINNIVTRLAGEGCTESTREDFQHIAFSGSDDTSNTSYGDLGIMDLNESYVNEFKLGLYAYDAIYNKAHEDNLDAEKLLAEDDVTMTSDDSKSVREYFEELGIGTIPYGAAVALGEQAEIEDADGITINNGSPIFFPRNVIYNKYFNKHNVAVIVPNKIFSQTHDWSAYEGLTSEQILAGGPTISPATEDDGEYSPEYAALPGFAKDTSALLGNALDQALTDKDGRIILVVKAGSASEGSYNGIHFIAINRSALDQFGSSTDGTTALVENTAKVDGTATLSEYYTLYAETDASYPTSSDGSKLLTYNNYIKRDTSDYIARRDTLRERVRNSIPNIDTYIFESLLKNGNLTYNKGENDKYAWVEESINNYITMVRKNGRDSTTKNFNESWAKYAQLIEMQEALREASESGYGELIPEICVLGYQSTDAQNRTGLFAKGGILGTAN